MSAKTEPEKSRERVVVTTFVEVKPHDAFEIFTRDIDRWWRREPRYRNLPGQSGKLCFEGTPPARLIEQRNQSDEPANSRLLGRVLAWEAGKRLVFEWRGGDFSAADHTEVEVRFEALRNGTRVTLEHRGLDSLPAQHPARHGFSGEAFEAMFGYFWADLLTSLRTHCTSSTAHASS